MRIPVLNLGDLLVDVRWEGFGLNFFIECPSSPWRDLIALCCGGKKLKGIPLYVADGYEFGSIEALTHFCFLLGIQCQSYNPYYWVEK
jgi:hypothetical protein